MEATQILSYGGGVQSVAMCVLVATGRLPKPDAVIAADTSREVPSTWDYAERYTIPLLASVGLQLHVAPHSLSTVDIYSGDDVILPLYTATGKLPTFCSTEWKARVVERFARTILKLAKPYTYWIGFSIDEARRATPRSDRKYPLIELMLARIDCVQIITDAGLPVPSKSRCWMCPHQTDAEWLQVKREWPELFEKACVLEDDIRGDDKFFDCYFHRQRKALREVVFDETSGIQAQQCGLGMCFI